MSNIRLMIAHDRRLFREGLRQICEQAGYEIAEIGKEENIRESAFRIKPDVILLDADIPFLSDIRLISDLAGKLPNTKIILFASSFQEEPVFEAVKAGAYGCLLRNVGIQELTEQINAAYQEKPWISPAIADKIIKEFSQFSRGVELTERAERLTREETEVLGIIAEGLGKKTAADRIRKSEDEVAEILNGVVRKLRANIDIFT